MYPSVIGANGAFYIPTQTGSHHKSPNDGTTLDYYKPSFNAHNSNSIYTDSGKVYPQSLALNFIIKT